MIDFDALLLAPCAAAFGETVFYLPAMGPYVTLQGIFTERFTETTFSDGSEIESTRTAINVRASQFPAEPVKGELFRIRGVLYVINEVQPDGLGDIRFYLGFATDADARRAALPPA